MPPLQQVFFVIVLSTPLQATADWKPPSNPDPLAILHEARKDTEAGRFDNALEKHLWFHGHALEPSLIGVRWHALNDWYALGKKYPPALKKLKETRDSAAKQVVDNRDDVRQAFRDMSSINEILQQEDRTVSVFIGLDKEAPNLARQVYELAQPALVKAKKFSMCGKYLEPEKSYARMVEYYQLDVEIADDEKSSWRKRFERDSAERHFLERAATLVALLVLNERKLEAENIAEGARSTSKYPDRDAVVDAALEGTLPKPRLGWSP